MAFLHFCCNTLNPTCVMWLSHGCSPLRALGLKMLHKRRQKDISGPACCLKSDDPAWLCPSKICFKLLIIFCKSFIFCLETCTSYLLTVCQQFVKWFLFVWLVFLKYKREDEHFVLWEDGWWRCWWSTHYYVYHERRGKSLLFCQRLDWHGPFFHWIRQAVGLWRSSISYLLGWY